jgi:tRNA1(Val) A37 N6-methylase TrmN6
MDCPTDPETELDETLDSINHIRIYQKKKGYRFSIDALILGSFILPKGYEQAIELGAGSAVVSLFIASKLKNTQIIAVEIQEELAKRAQKSVSLNNRCDQIKVVHENIIRLPHIYKPALFDLAFSNPPFRKKATGLLSPNREISIAKHEIMLNLEDLIKTTAFLLKHKGSFCIIYHPLRLAELFSLLHAYRLEPKRLRFVHDKDGEQAKMALVEAVKGSGQWLQVEYPLIIHNMDGSYSREMEIIFNE